MSYPYLPLHRNKYSRLNTPIVRHVTRDGGRRDMRTATEEILVSSTGRSSVGLYEVYIY